MLQSLEEGKQEFRDTLKASLISQKRPSFTWSNKTYLNHESTWDIANTFPYYQSTDEVFVVGNNRWHALGGVFCLIIVFFIIVFAKAYEQPIAIIFLAIFVWMGLKIIMNALDRKVKLIIDKKGIFYHDWLNYIKWEDVAATYIKELYDGENTNRFLVIFFYDTEEEVFKQKEASIDGLKTDVREVSFFVEYIKMKAGYPTHKD